VSSQTAKGKAFEYATLISIYNRLSSIQNVSIENNESFNIAKNFYDNLTDLQRIEMDRAATAGIRLIERVEPQLQNPDSNSSLILSIQPDSAGVNGDVRDVICMRMSNGWEIGISCKHNHDAVKHSRLSPSIDFGQKWFNKPCSNQYFTDINLVFDTLRTYMNSQMTFNDIPDKAGEVYYPIMMAFIEEIRRLDAMFPGQIAEDFIRYLLGRNDFYKVISNSNETTSVQIFNMNGTLNRPSQTVRPLFRIPALNFPSRIFDIRFSPGSQNTCVITFDNGWAVSFRIHNARTLVETSLKFDVKLVGIPSTLTTFVEQW